MLKLISIILLFLLTSCSVQRITEVLFIASIGIELEDDSLVGYFYLPSSEDVGKSSELNDGIGQYAKIKADNISMLFGKSQAYTEMEMDLKHVASIIINYQLLTPEFIDEMLAYFKNTTICDLNFYLFITKDKMDDIFTFQNPNKESVINSVLVSTSDSSASFLSCNPLHYLNFCRDYLLNKCLKLPFLSVDKIWNVDKEEIVSYHLTEMVLFYNNVAKVVNSSLGFYMKKNTHFVDEMGACPYEIKDYDFNLKVKDKIEIDIVFKYRYLSDVNHSMNEIIHNNIKEFIQRYESMDPLNINYYSYVYNKDLKYEDLIINVKSTMF